MKKFMFLLAALAALTLSSVSCNKGEENSLVGTRWTYNSLISSMSIFFLKDGYCSIYLSVGEQTVGNKGSYRGDKGIVGPTGSDQRVLLTLITGNR